MDDFTLENGATACVPYTQQEVCWPNEDEFDNNFIQITGKKGTTMMFTGLLHHAARTNNSKTGTRTSILGQYLPKYVRPMEDPKDIGEEVRQRATPRMKQLLGFHQLYPKSFDQEDKVVETPKEATISDQHLKINQACTSANMVMIHAQSAGFDGGDLASVAVNGMRVTVSPNENKNLRGLHIVVVNPFNGNVEWA